MVTGGVPVAGCGDGLGKKGDPVVGTTSQVSVLPLEMLVLGAFAQLPGHNCGLVVFEREDKEAAQLLLRKLPFYVENIPVVVVQQRHGVKT